jgi:phosphohistidine phosphatase
MSTDGTGDPADILATMQLLIVRHAEAAPGEPDELRPLTSVGRDQARALGIRLREEGVRPDAILTSPLLRARETGKLIGRELGLDPEPDERLAPGADSAAVTAAARERKGSILVVCHQPDCSQIAASLAGGPEPAFPPASFVAVDL